MSKHVAEDCPRGAEIDEIKIAINEIAGLKAMFGEISELRKSVLSIDERQDETLLMMKQLIDQDTRIVHNEIELRKARTDLNKLYNRVRVLEAIPQNFPNWKKGLILYLAAVITNGAVLLWLCRRLGVI